MALTLSSVCFLAFAQKTIQGTVKDANGDPMIGVTITDQNGKGHNLRHRLIVLLSKAYTMLSRSNLNLSLT